MLDLNFNVMIRKVKNKFVVLSSKGKRLSRLTTKKKAYIISKMVDGKTEREQYKKYPELVNAVDAYIDIKKLISKKPYN